MMVEVFFDFNVEIFESDASKVSPISQLTCHFSLSSINQDVTL